jgi:putative flippase GtrA
MKQHLIRLAKNKEHHVLQFFKYGLCGGLATVVDIAIFYGLALFVFPALGETDVMIRVLGDFARIADSAAQMERNFVVNSIMAFVGSNVIAYVLNVWLVFHSDKDSRHKELVLFFAVSGVSIVIGISLGWLLVRLTGVASWGYLMKVISSLLINYAGRKIFVFKYRKQKVEVTYES